MKSSMLMSLFIALSLSLLTGSFIFFPKEVVDASIRGLHMWWEIVFPSLLPFFIMSELLIGFGVVNFIGVLLEPFMRPIFRVPGAGGFVWAMGMASGFPSGAKLTARLRQKGQISKIEAERLVSFTNSSNPLFIFGAVAVGFFHNPSLGIILALSHYIGNVGVGLVMRFYGREKEVPSESRFHRSFSIQKAFHELHVTRIKETRPFGQILGDSVISSVNTLLLIGGFIILFSVVNQILYRLNITDTFAFLVGWVFHGLHFPSTLSIPFISGLFEITLGSQLTSDVKNVDLMHQAMLTSFILAFSGFSVHAQVASILADTDIRFTPFFLARILHGCFSSILTWLCWSPIYERFFMEEQPADVIPVFLSTTSSLIHQSYYMISSIGPLFTIIVLVCYCWIYRQKIIKIAK
ncbi:sporulation integral membrane protein YlbJ [Aeribacillus pallidus]|uniref:sporulation integral membrane protein YlbJ n=1 Tax=Aeribacillus pallidus TaxID=33936 RepID=UPI003D1AE37B